MGWFLLILVLLAAAFGILGAVVKLTAIIVFTLVSTVVVLSIIGWWLVKRQLKRIMREFDESSAHLRMTRYRKNEADNRLPSARDDRY